MAIKGVYMKDKELITEDKKALDEALKESARLLKMVDELLKDRAKKEQGE